MTELTDELQGEPSWYVLNGRDRKSSGNIRIGKPRVMPDSLAEPSNSNIFLEDVEFEILGPIRGWHHGFQISLGSAVRKRILFILLLNSGKRVGIDRLIEAAWGSDLPSTTPGALQMHISRIRNSIGAPKEGGLEWDSFGYALRIPEKNVDINRFRFTVARAHQSSDPGMFADLLQRSLDIFSGAPLEDIAETPLLSTLRSGLLEERLAVLEKRLHADLKMGFHQKLLLELPLLVFENPFREEFIEIWMRALHSCGRRAEALNLYRRTREDFVENLGIEPGFDLQATHAKILNGTSDE